MMPIGEQLKIAREQKGLSVERVAEETNIARRYISALEAEDFGVFPGDPYVIGFLRNYADFLGLRADELVTSYKNMQIQEQPVPLEDLIPKRRRPLGLMIAIGAALIALGVAAFLIFGRQRGTSSETARVESHSPTEYALDTASFEKRLYVGDSLLVTLGSEKYKLGITKIDEALTVETPSGPIRLMLGEEGTVDLDKNNQPDLKLLLSDLSKKDPSRGAVLKIESADAALLAAQNPAAATGGLAEGAAALGTQAPATEAESAAALLAAANASTAGAPAITPAAASKPLVLIEAGRSPYPFVLSATFRGSSMLRYEVDRRDRDERYYRKGDTITVNANNTVKLWVSNAQAVKLTVQASGGKSVDLEMGGPGEVVVKRIVWTQTDQGSWNLCAIDVE